MSYREIYRKELPAWYHLAISPVDASLIVSVHPAAEVQMLRALTADRPDVAYLAREHGLPPFIAPVGHRTWGFGQVIRVLPLASDGWLKLCCRLPRAVRSREPFKCDWDKPLAVSASLHVLFEALNDCELQGLPVAPSQLLGVSLHLGGGGSGSLYGQVSRRLYEWIRDHACNQLGCEQIMDAMTAGHRRLWGEDEMMERYLRAWFRDDGTFILDYPGNAVDIGPDGSQYPGDIADGYGYELFPHNTDNHIQILTLLWGLAKLDDFVRQDLYGPDPV